MGSIVKKYAFALSIFIGGCSALPDVTLTDRISDADTIRLVEDSVRVVEPEDALSFDDASWPSPIQVTAPVRVGDRINGSYSLKLFNRGISGQRIDVVLVGDSGRQCEALLERLGVSNSEFFIIAAENSNNYLQCENGIIGVPKGSVNPFKDGYKYVEIKGNELVTISKDLESDQAIKGAYNPPSIDMNEKDRKIRHLIIRYRK